MFIPDICAPLISHPVVGSTPARRAVCTRRAKGSTGGAGRRNTPGGPRPSGSGARPAADPTHAGVPAEARLQPGRQTAHGHPAHLLVAPTAQFSHGSTPRTAHVSTGSSTTRVPADSSSQSSRSPHDLVARNERQRDEGGEVETGLAGQRAEVRTADPGEPGADPRPAWRSAWGGRSWPGAGCRVARRSPGIREPIALPATVRGSDRNISSASIMRTSPLSCASPGSCPAPGGIEAPGRARGARQVRHVPMGSPRMAIQRHIGTDRDGVADRFEQRQVGVGVGVAEGCGHVDAVLCGVRPHPGRPGLSTRGEVASWPVHAPRSSTARSAASMWSKRGRSGRVSGRIAPVMSTV